jgi:hypothetical protein
MRLRAHLFSSYLASVPAIKDSGSWNARIQSASSHHKTAHRLSPGRRAREGLMLGIRQPLDGPVFEKLEHAQFWCWHAMVDHYDRGLGSPMPSSICSRASWTAGRRRTGAAAGRSTNLRAGDQGAGGKQPQIDMDAKDIKAALEPYVEPVIITELETIYQGLLDRRESVLPIIKGGAAGDYRRIREYSLAHRQVLLHRAIGTFLMRLKRNRSSRCLSMRIKLSPG